ncbi:hypothetical protein DKX38_025711 [Salix brachista]|uniref:Uncharacterized protein n=1 Tax=Salix brachista TaxID=2182728 RepID=A0A5N5JQH5_9ROSI|nr:hypothetical protein DKX38_025711 [Salix brachista]
MGLGSLRFGLDLVVLSVFVRGSENLVGFGELQENTKRKEGRKEESGADGGEVFQIGTCVLGHKEMTFS